MCLGYIRHKEQQPEMVPFSTCSSLSKHQRSRITSHAPKVKNKCPEVKKSHKVGEKKKKAKNAGNVLSPQLELSEWECLPGTAVLSRQRGNGSFCIPLKLSGQQVENRENSYRECFVWMITRTSVTQTSSE